MSAIWSDETSETTTTYSSIGSEFLDDTANASTILGGGGGSSPQSTPTSAPIIVDYDPNISTLTNQQESIMSALGLISGVLSMIGSSMIVYRVIFKKLTKGNKRSNPTAIPTSSSRSSIWKSLSPYDRLLLGLSICDIISSFSHSFAPLLLPKETSTRAWARFGNDTTCTLLGFTTQVGFGAVLYNGMLSFYYLLTVRYQMKRVTFTQRYEIWIHIFIIAFCILTSCIGLVINLYSELEITQLCWIGEYPKDCEATDSCQLATIIGWVYGGLPTLFAFLCIPINNISIYRYVRNQLSSQSQSSQSNTNTRGQNTQGNHGDNNSSHNDEDINNTGRPSSSASSVSSRSSSRATTNSTSISRSNLIRIREVATQGFLYVGSFYFCYTAAFVIRILEGLGMNGEKEADIYPILVLNSVLLPLQGFLNFFIYARPNYKRIKYAFPERPLWWKIKCACIENDIPRLTSTGSSRNLYSAASDRNMKKQQQHQHQNRGLSNDSSLSSNNSGGNKKNISFGKLSSSGRYSKSSGNRSDAQTLDPVAEVENEDVSVDLSIISNQENRIFDESRNNNDNNTSCHEVVEEQPKKEVSTTSLSKHLQQTSPTCTSSSMTSSYNNSGTYSTIDMTGSITNSNNGLYGDDHDEKDADDIHEHMCVLERSY